MRASSALSEVGAEASPSFPGLALLGLAILSAVLGGYARKLRQRLRQEQRERHREQTATQETLAARQRAEQSLARAAITLSHLEEAGQVGSWELDLHTRALHWSARTYRIHGRDPQLGAPALEKWIEGFAPGSRPLLHAAVGRARREGAGFDLELEHIAPEGRRWLRAIGYPRQEAGLLYGTLQDVTEQKLEADHREKLQQKMLEAQKLESLGVLSGGIAHDLNNLLTTVLGHASLARLGTDLESHLQQIENATQQAAALCQQVLSYAGRVHVHRERLDLNRTVQETTHLLQACLRKGARLDYDLAPSLPAIDGDPSQLTQVLTNLATNAAESLPAEGGVIRIRTASEWVEPADAFTLGATPPLPAGHYVVLEVTDNGCGVQPQALERIFDPFFTTKLTGRGLGLPATLGIVQAHRGALSISSRPGEGSSFRVIFPPTSPAIAASPSPPNEGPEADLAGRFLVIDDEPSVREITQAILQHYGATAVVAGTGREGVERLREAPGGFAAILLDMTLGGQNGPETLRQLRQVAPEVRVLLMSGYNEEGVSQAFQGQRIDGFLSKPFSPPRLLTKLRQVLAPPEEATS